MKFSTLVWIVVCVVLYAIYVSPRSPPSLPLAETKAEPVQAPAPPSPPKPQTCGDSWRFCQTNEEAANSDSNDYVTAEIDCKYAANKLAKFGSPDWSWFPFTSYMPGDTIKTTGVMTLVDKTVTFKNRFNADAHVRVICEYDFNAKTVKYVDVQEQD